MMVEVPRVDGSLLKMIFLKLTRMSMINLGRCLSVKPFLIQVEVSHLDGS